MNPQDKKVSLEIPLNTQMKIFAFLFKENYSMSELFSGVREVGYYGESPSFSISTNTNSLSLGITLQSTGTDTNTGGGSTDTTPPVIAEVTAVTTPTSDSTPDYTFHTTEAGSITYGGSCYSSTIIAYSGNNTITFNALSDDTYSDCTITVKDSAGNVSNTLTIPTFTVDTTVPGTTAPTVSSIYPADNQRGVSVSDNISVTFSEAMDSTSVTTNTSNSSCSGSFELSSDNFINCVQMSSSPSSSNSDMTFTIDPSDNLTGSTTYLTRVTTGVKDSAGDTLSSQYVTSSGFTTESLPDTTLLAHYAFEDNLNDNSSYNRHLTEVGSNITYSAADNQSNKSGQAALFNGTDTYAYTDNISISSTDNFTIAFWVRPDSPNMSQWDSVMSTGDSTSGGRFQIDYSGNDNIRFVVSGATLSMALDNNTWNHFVYTKTYTSTSNKLQFYKNGSSQGSSAPVVTRWDKLKIGLNRNGGGYWKGYIDELKIYNRAFTGTEVSTLFESY